MDHSKRFLLKIMISYEQYIETIYICEDLSNKECNKDRFLDTPTISRTCKNRFSVKE